MERKAPNRVPGLTLNQAMRLCRQRHGRLPSIGCEMPVREEDRKILARDAHTNRPKFITVKATVWLANEGGKYRMQEYTDMSNVVARAW